MKVGEVEAKALGLQNPVFVLFSLNTGKAPRDERVLDKDETHLATAQFHGRRSYSEILGVKTRVCHVCMCMCVRGVLSIERSFSVDRVASSTTFDVVVISKFRERVEGGVRENVCALKQTERSFFLFFFFLFYVLTLVKTFFFFFERDSLVNKKRSSKTLFSIRLDTWYPFRFSSVSFRSQPRRAATRARDKHTRVCTNVRRHTVSKMFSSLYMLHMYVYIYICTYSYMYTYV